MAARTACGTSRINCPSDDTPVGVLTGDVVTNLNNGAWCVHSWTPIFRRTMRGENIALGGVAYSIPLPVVRSEVVIPLQMTFGGDVDQDGDSHAPLNIMEGLEANLFAFMDAAVEPPSTTNNLFSLSLTTLTDVLTIPLQVISFEHQDVTVTGYARAVWTVRLPLGY